MRDFKKLQQDPPEGVNGSPNPDNIMLWNAVIFGPEDTPWDGGAGIASSSHRPLPSPPSSAQPSPLGRAVCRGCPLTSPPDPSPPPRDLQAHAAVLRGLPQQGARREIHLNHVPPKQCGPPLSPLLCFPFLLLCPSTPCQHCMSLELLLPVIPPFCFISSSSFRVLMSPVQPFTTPPPSPSFSAMPLRCLPFCCPCLYSSCVPPQYTRMAASASTYCKTSGAPSTTFPPSSPPSRHDIIPCCPTSSLSSFPECDASGDEAEAAGYESAAGKREGQVDREGQTVDREPRDAVKGIRGLELERELSWLLFRHCHRRGLNPFKPIVRSFVALGCAGS